MTLSDVCLKLLPAAGIFVMVFGIHSLAGLPTVLVAAALADCGLRAIEHHRDRHPH